MISPESENLLARVRIASPCPVSWDEMKGDERKRFCGHCNLHVYNISAMTHSEAESLLKTAEGRLCARLYRREDGTVLTQDCPVGLKALRRRLKMRVGVFASMLFGFCLTAFGQDAKKTEEANPKTEVCVTKQLNVTREVLPKDKRDSNPQQKILSSINGVLSDPNGGLLTRVSVKLINEKTKEVITVVTDEKGVFDFPLIASGSYTLDVEAAGFERFIMTQFVVGEAEKISISLIVPYGEVLTGVVEIIPPKIKEGNTVTIKDDVLRKLPF